ncbi:hypothetical protein [Haladaptatus sp. DJG-WS-42]|uniref:hypothetical protein n=1 Tax=Haladaptatus sp. DJG-WS-42 TaxID=3120516 RepID=UPI0030D41FB1
MSSVVSVTTEEKDGEERERRNPFGNARIEVDDRELKTVSPGAWLSGLKTRLDTLATRLTYGN